MNNVAVRVPDDLEFNMVRAWDELFDVNARVPERFLLGRAFFVYWPAGFRPLPMAPALAPDFGDMRFIR